VSGKLAEARDRTYTAEMKPTPFSADTDLAPIPFERNLCEAAARLKEAGLVWKPHTGCFVWDPHNRIPASSPFPNNIYFVLNLNRFLTFFESEEQMRKELTWLPTWNQGRILCGKLGLDHTIPTDTHSMVGGGGRPLDDYLELYERILTRLKDS
jgi:hypothetical protein